MIPPTAIPRVTATRYVLPLREGSVRDLRNGTVTTAVPGESGAIKVQTCINAAAGPCHIDH